MDAFATLERWGIKHLSPSAINCWAEDRATWVIRYALKVREPASPAMIRGRAVEDGLSALFYGKSLDEAREIATRLYALEIEREGLAGEEADAEASIIVPMVDQCDAALQARSLPTPNATQLRCEGFIDGEGWSVPILGYADFCFDGWALDLKTTKALPSKPKPAHLVQVAFYAKARKDENAALFYVTPKKWAIYDLQSDELEAAWKALAPHARSLLRALYRAKDAQDLATDCPPPIDHWSWDAERRARAAEMVTAWAA